MGPTEIPVGSGATSWWLGWPIGVGPAVDGLGLKGTVGVLGLGTLFLRRVTGRERIIMSLFIL